ncbi:DASH outer kinetochore protein [Mycena pura]|uniref:DASH complex subunit DAD1 n=1 Tax=Mycena pura TaxID=153505 RepID=A0AAD6V4H5_9AGAR|nr:DASH outer kinetochore protein [Mycena pura]
MSQLGQDAHSDQSFFERERERLTREITADFDDVLSSTNTLNRKLEEVLGMTKEYATIAALWSSFHQLMSNYGREEAVEEQAPTASGTGKSTQ